jgi:hypothetical protein
VRTLHIRRPHPKKLRCRSKGTDVMGERKFTKKKPRVKLSVAPERRKLAIIVAALTIGAVALDSELLGIFSSDDSATEASQESDAFSELESMLAELDSDAETPNTPQSDPAGGPHAVATDELTPLLIPHADTPTKISASNVSFPQQLYSETAHAQPDNSVSPSEFPGGGRYGSNSPRPEHRASVTGIRFTGKIQPIQ